MAQQHTRRDSHQDTRQTGKEESPRARPGADGGQQREGPGTELRDSPMMAHLMEALEKGLDIGHYGRLTFVMVARFFMQDNEMVNLLKKQPCLDAEQAKALVLEVKAHDYNPPTREKIEQWQARQDFRILPDTDDPRSGNLYSELQFPESVYEHINEFYEEQVEAHESGDQTSR